MRAIVNVATGSYARGQCRMIKAFPGGLVRAYRDCLPMGSPRHEDVPYAFKSFALKEAADAGVKTLLWVDACIVPGPRPLEELWQRIERDGYWISNNGFTNYEWTADAAYPDLFTDDDFVQREDGPSWMEEAEALNRTIPHVVATTFGISLEHPIGRAILEEYLRLAKTKAFCGPWINWNHAYNEPAGSFVGQNWKGERTYPCGQSDVRGHRHDQTALSVIAWRLGCKLTNGPEWFSYRGGENETTCLVADGAY